MRARRGKAIPVRNTHSEGAGRSVKPTTWLHTPVRRGVDLDHGDDLVDLLGLHLRLRAGEPGEHQHHRRGLGQRRAGVERDRAADHGAQEGESRRAMGKP